MNLSFYVGALGAKGSSDKISVVANNLANINNDGFKPKTAVFTDLLNYNLNDSEEATTDLQAGNGVRVQRTSTDFSMSGITQTGDMYDYAIMQGNAFFMLQNPETGEITYTRDGHFHRGEMEDGFYLMSDTGKYVLDEDGEPILLEVLDIEKINEMRQGEYDEDEDDEEDDEEKQKVGVYTFSNPSRLMSAGDNEYMAGQELTPQLVENPGLMTGALETSGTDLAKEMTRVIECQRAFSYALKMGQTSDEIESTINSLRG